MRIGYNPHKDQIIEKTDYIHQVIIPVFIPNHSDYFKESFSVLELCLKSLFQTVHSKTFITIVNNGSCDEVKEYLQQLFDEHKIHEIIHTTNIGKLNAIVKGLSGTNFELVTISDADVLFVKGWQSETIAIFKQLPKVGVVGIVPQFNLHKVNSVNLLVDNLWNASMKFLPVKNEKALSIFYDSIGWDKNYNHDYLKFSLGLQWSDDLTVLVGSGHFVATYKRNIFENIVTYNPYKMGGYSEDFLDTMPLKKDYWRVTTYDNYAYHIGNSIEPWMLEIADYLENKEDNAIEYGFKMNKQLFKISFLIRIKIPQYIYKKKFVYRAFLKWKKLPITMIKKY